MAAGSKRAGASASAGMCTSLPFSSGLCLTIRRPPSPEQSTAVNEANRMWRERSTSALATPRRATAMLAAPSSTDRSYASRGRTVSFGDERGVGLVTATHVVSPVLITESPATAFAPVGSLHAIKAVGLEQPML